LSFVNLQVSTLHDDTSKVQDSHFNMNSNKLMHLMFTSPNGVVIISDCQIHAGVLKPDPVTSLTPHQFFHRRPKIHFCSLLISGIMKAGGILCK